MTGRKTHKSMYSPKYPEKYKGDPEKIVCRSSWERAMCRWLDLNPKVTWWTSEEFNIKYIHPIKRKTSRYFPDFYFEITDKEENTKRIIVEVKPYKETLPPVTQTKSGRARRKKLIIEEKATYLVNQAKWRAAKIFAERNEVEFRVWTEKALKKLGILI